MVIPFDKSEIESDTKSGPEFPKTCNFEWSTYKALKSIFTNITIKID